jgi:hypothetical protein
MTQERYASEILQRVNMQLCKPVKTSLCTTEKLSITSGTVFGPLYGCNNSFVVSHGGGSSHLLFNTQP